MSKSRTNSGVLAVLDHDARVPVHRQIETSIRDSIRAGRLPRGSPLPLSRVLTADLGISRGVVEAYQQLTAEGYLAGSGVPQLRTAIAGYLNRVRGTLPQPSFVHDSVAAFIDVEHAQELTAAGDGPGTSVANESLQLWSWLASRLPAEPAAHDQPADFSVTDRAAGGGQGMRLDAASSCDNVARRRLERSARPDLPLPDPAGSRDARAEALPCSQTLTKSRGLSP